MQNAEGKQLMLEAIALIGALLLALDRQIHGMIRERVVVAYYRLRGGAQARQQAPLHSLLRPARCWRACMHTVLCTWGGFPQTLWKVC